MFVEVRHWDMNISPEEGRLTYRQKRRTSTNNKEVVSPKNSFHIKCYNLHLEKTSNIFFCMKKTTHIYYLWTSNVLFPMRRKKLTDIISLQTETILERTGQNSVPGFDKHKWTIRGKYLFQPVVADLSWGCHSTDNIRYVLPGSGFRSTTERKMTKIKWITRLEKSLSLRFFLSPKEAYLMYLSTRKFLSVSMEKEYLTFSFIKKQNYNWRSIYIAENIWFFPREKNIW